MTKNQEDYAFFKSIGVCPHCKKNKAAPHRVRCEECLARNAESAQRKRTETGATSDKDYSKKRRQNLKDHGLCVWCGKPISRYSVCFCPECRIKNQQKNENRKDGIARSERYLYGMCYRCGKHELVPGKKLCRSCLEQNMKNLPEEKHIIRAWKNDNNRVFGKKVSY